jgi:hypothetical protein
MRLELGNARPIVVLMMTGVMYTVCSVMRCVTGWRFIWCELSPVRIDKCQMRMREVDTTDAIRAVGGGNIAVHTYDGLDVSAAPDGDRPSRRGNTRELIPRRNAPQSAY